MPGKARDECALTLHSIPYRQCLSAVNDNLEVIYVVELQFLTGNVLASQGISKSKGDYNGFQFLIGNVLAHYQAGLDYV